MAKSDIAMSADEMTAELSDMDPRGKGGEPDKPEPRTKAKAEPEDDIEYVGPEDGKDGEDGADKGKKPDTAAKDARPKDGDGKAKAEPAKKPDAKAPDGFVPHSALHAEREEHKKTRQEVASLRQQYEAKFNTILAELTKASQERQTPAKTEPEIDLGPDPEKDPIGAAVWLRQQRAADLRQRQEWAAKQAEQSKTETTQREQWEAFNRDLASANRDWEQVVAAVPEMDGVLGGLRESFRREYVALGWHGPQLIQKINELEAQHAVHAFRRGIPIAEYVAQLAAARGVQMPQRQAPTNGDGQGDEPDDKPNGKAADGAAEIERLAKAQDAGNPLSEGGGGAPGGNKMSFDSLDRMSQKEIEAWVRAATKKGGPDAVNKALARMMGAGR